MKSTFLYFKFFRLYLWLLVLVEILPQCSNYSKVINIKDAILMPTSLDSMSIKPILLKPMKMVSLDSLIIILDNSSDTLFRIFNYKDLKYLGWFGKKGRGPREFLGLNATAVRPSPEGIQIADMRRIYFISLPKINFNNNYILHKQVLIPSKLLAFNNMFVLDSNKIFGICRSKNAPRSIDYFDIRTSDIGSIVNYPEFIKDVPNELLRSVFDLILDVNPNHINFAIIYNFFPILRICNKSGDILKEIVIKGLPEQIIFNGLGTREGNLLYGINYYSEIKVTKNYIYLLYSPRKGERISEHEFIMKSIHPMEFHIFDWEGNCVGRILLNRAVSSYTPTADDSYLYFTQENEANQIFRLNLKSALSKSVDEN